MSGQLSKDSFHWPVRVYYEDTDSGGVVYYANYLKYMERARTEWLRALGVEQDILLAEENIIFAVRSASIEYQRPARFNDALEVVTTLSATRKVSFTFEHKIYLQQDVNNDGAAASPLCCATVKVASLDSETFRPKHVPRHLIMELKGAN